MKKNILGTIIKDARKKKKMTQSELSKLTGYNQNTISNHENGNRSLGEKEIKNYASALSLTPDDLFEAFDIKNSMDNNIMFVDAKQTLNDNLADIYNELSEQRKEKVYAYAETQLNDQRNNIVEFPTKRIKNGRSSAAGEPLDGDYQDHHSSTMIVNTLEIPKGADEIVTIAGDSMEPTYEQGSQVFVSYQPNVEQGEVAIVSIVDEGVTCKRVYYDVKNDEVILKSINDKYEDMILPVEDIRIIGKVL